MQIRQKRAPGELLVKKIAVFLCIAPAILFCLSVAHGKEAPTPELRGIWVIRTTLVSPAQITEMVRRAKDANINTLIVQVRGRGDAYYHSRWEPRAEELRDTPATFDPLAQVIDEAHKAGLKVHAWINMGFVAAADSRPASPDHIVNRHPEWLMVHRQVAAQLFSLSPKDPEYLNILMKKVDDDKSEIEGLYGSYAVPEVKEHLYNIAMDITEHYEVDGIHLDYIRYASKSLDYNRVTLARFRAEIERAMPPVEKKALADAALTDPFVFTTTFPERWAQFLQDQVTAVVERIGVGLHARKPEALLTAAVLANDEAALNKCSQDWKLWLERDLLDAVCPMAYTADSAVFRRQVGKAKSSASGHQVWAGVGAYRMPVESTIEKIGIARKCGVEGVVLFSYDDMVKISKTNPKGEYLEALKAGVFRDAAGLPSFRRGEEK
jgi:uncharacterized lipoprotein YddW (UPF0748 family)